MATTVTMRCAGEGPEYPEREFLPHDDDSDFTCSDCGWMQTSFANGLRELCGSATWHSVDEFIRIRDWARELGAENVPDNPRFNTFQED